LVLGIGNSEVGFLSPSGITDCITGDGTHWVNEEDGGSGIRTGGSTLGVTGCDFKFSDSKFLILSIVF
jgi:hypothetical protein